MTNAVSGTSVGPVLPPESDDAALPGVGLLPPPAGGVAFSGDMSAIFTLLSQRRGVELAQSESAVAENKDQQDQALASQLAAIAREAANQSSSGGGFFGSIGAFFSDVARDVLQGNIGDAINDGGRDLEAAWNSPHLWSDLENGLEAISVVGAAVSQVAQQIGGPVGTVVAVVACDVDQGADLCADLAGAREESFAATAKGAAADAVASKADLGRLQTAVGTVLDDAKSNDASLGRALDGVVSAFSINDHALVASAASAPVKG